MLCPSCDVWFPPILRIVGSLRQAIPDIFYFFFLNSTHHTSTHHSPKRPRRWANRCIIFFFFHYCRRQKTDDEPTTFFFVVNFSLSFFYIHIARVSNATSQHNIFFPTFLLSIRSRNWICERRRSEREREEGMHPSWEIVDLDIHHFFSPPSPHVLFFSLCTLPLRGTTTTHLFRLLPFLLSSLPHRACLPTLHRRDSFPFLPLRSSCA